MSDAIKAQEEALENLRSGNSKLSDVVRDAVYSASVKAQELILTAENPKDLLDNIKVIETAAKVVGLTPKENQVNVQINAINGFDFVEIDDDYMAQLTYDEEVDDGDRLITAD